MNISLQRKSDYATKLGGKGVIEMGKTPKKLWVFIIDEHGRTLTKESLHRLLAELFDNALDARNVDAVVANGPTLNICIYLINQIAGKDVADWDIVYLHGNKYPPVLLSQEDKENLVALLPGFVGTSAAAIYKILTDSGSLDKFFFEKIKEEQYA